MGNKILILSLLMILILFPFQGKTENVQKYASYAGISITYCGDFQGAVSDDGTTILECAYDIVMIPEFGLIRYSKNGLWGLCRSDGSAVLECKYSYITPFERNRSPYNPWLACYFSNNKFGIVNSRGCVVTEPLFDESIRPLEHLYKNGLALSQDGLWGVISPVDGSVLVEFSYDSFELLPYHFEFLSFGNEYYIVPCTDKVTTCGLDIFDIAYDTELEADSFSVWIRTISQVYQNTEWVLVTPEGKQIGVITEPSEISDAYRLFDRGITRHFYRPRNIVVYFNISGEVVQQINNITNDYAFEAFGMEGW